MLTDRRSWFIDLIAQHLMLSGISIFFAGTIGLSLGILIFERKRLAGIVLGIVNAIYTIPDIAMFGFLIPLLGIGNKAAIVAITVYAQLPMVRNTYTGLNQVDADIIEAAVGMGSTRRQLLFKIQLPLAFPVILSGIRNMVVMAVSVAGIASFIGAGGLGKAIYRGIATNNQQLMIVGSLLIACIAIFLDFFFGALEKLSNSRDRRKHRKGFGVLSVILVIVIAFVSCSILSDVKNKKITVGYDNTAEEAIIANILILLIENNTDITVEEMGDLAGGETVMMPAARHGEIDIYPEYTGTAWLTILKHDNIPDQEEMNRRIKDEYKKEYDLTWYGMYGFNDSYGIAVSNKVAKEYGLETYSDLARVSKYIKFGAEPGFYERSDGYDGLCREYGFAFRSSSEINFSLKYKALEEKSVDAIIVFTTDGQLYGADVTLLKDDKNYFPKYLCGNVVRVETLKEYPELYPVLEMTNGILNDSTMSRLNKEVEVDGREPAEVARAYLKSKGLIK
ncbi:MAG: ABC transporter permease/substrate-binding protein [Mobilibacterium timonense]|uniref:ABC transporter permease/substrate-binding protein n=1 Tax=Mobilibacterium timonense TaxID=1871012 RepID=UPI0023544C0F|nr:ABC transporter permease/substrate-binding protein [Mobilibacterium timonense]MBM6990228.1 ABC transporter permease/substrate-binding protein [Mobilibacterium timonense]